MSTAINITVDDGGLPARNRQQVAANRQAFVQNVAAEQSTALGLSQRSQDRITQGRDPVTGALLVPPTSTGALGAFGGNIPRLNQQPAANRTGTAAPENPLVLDFSTAGNPVIYTGMDGNLIESTGRAKYRNNALDSLYRVTTSDGPGLTRPLQIYRRGGPFNQAYVSAAPNSTDNNGAIQVAYPSAWPEGTPYSDQVFHSPPFVPPNFAPNLSSPQTIETDILFASLPFYSYGQIIFRLSLLSNSIIANERELANAIRWTNSAYDPPKYGFYLYALRSFSAPPYSETEIGFVDFLSSFSINGEITGETVYSADLSTLPYAPGWRRFAISVGNTGIRYHESSNLTYLFGSSLANYFNSLPTALDGYTWVPSIEIQTESNNGSTPTPAGVSTVRYSNKKIGSTYIPGRLS